jgi:hypothetical protein
MTRSTTISRLTLAALTLPFAFIPVPAAYAATVIINDGNCASFSFDANSQTLTCNTGSAPPTGAPSGCSLSASPTSLGVGGGNVALTANCSSGSPTGYRWTGGNVVASTTANSQNASITATTTFSVTPYNGAGSATTQYATVSVATGENPPSTGPISCSGFSSTKVLDISFPPNGGTSKRYYTYNGIYSQGSAGWGPNDAIVVRFTAPAADPYIGVALAATGGMINRTVNLSTNSCEFSQTASSVYFTETSDLSLSLASGPSQYVQFQLVPGQTYYMNLANRAGGVNTCVDSSCDAVLMFQNPQP